MAFEYEKRNAARLLDALDGDAVKLMQSEAKMLMEVEGVGPKIAGTLSGWRKHFDLKRELALLEKHKVNFITWEDEEYPSVLRQIPDPPIGLYKCGSLSLKEVRCIGIVGTRKATLYGQKQAGRIAARVARRFGPRCGPPRNGGASRSATSPRPSSTGPSS